MAESSSKEQQHFWKERLAPFKGADVGRSVRQLTVTLGVYFALWAAMVWSLQVGYWLTLIIAVPAAGFMMRVFLIQHDCGHGSYLKSRKRADLLGFWLGVLTLTPYKYWRKTHAYHHAHSGDLDFRGFGDITTHTLAEYRAMGFWGRLNYRIYRHPVVLFTVGGIFLFVFKHRFPWDVPRSWTQAWKSVWQTNAAIVGVLVVAHFTIGLTAFAMVHLPVLLVGTTLGVWLFYVQHQFEDTYWHDHNEWEYYEAGLEGSSHLVLPRPLQWLTAHIGVHHVHHIGARIPNYRLEECVEAVPELQKVRHMTFWDGMKTLHLALWDEDTQRLITFREAHRTAA